MRVKLDNLKVRAGHGRHFKAIQSISISGCFDDFSCFNAASTNVDFSDTSLFDHRPDSLEVGIETSFVQVMGMTDIIANHWFFSADSTLF